LSVVRTAREREERTSTTSTPTPEPSLPLPRCSLQTSHQVSMLCGQDDSKAKCQERDTHPRSEKSVATHHVWHVRWSGLTSQRVGSGMMPS
jgi:hypothetical protein